MYFNFKLFSVLAARAFKNVSGGEEFYTDYSLEYALLVFEYYFQKYEDTLKRVHPNIRLSQIERIIEIMPYIDNDGQSSAGGDMMPDDYEPLIDRHFQTQYRNCDYNINHFFSGDIRLMRYYEEFY